jgi:hypothetical protein
MTLFSKIEIASDWIDEIKQREPTAFHFFVYKTYLMNNLRLCLVLGCFTVGFFFLSQPERKVLNSKIETKHYTDFLWIMTVKTPLKTDDFVNLSLKSSPEQKLYRFEN